MWNFNLSSYLEALIKEPVFQHISESELDGGMIMVTRFSEGSSPGSEVYLKKGEEVSYPQFKELSGEW